MWTSGETCLVLAAAGIHFSLWLYEGDLFISLSLLHRAYVGVCNCIQCCGDSHLLVNCLRYCTVNLLYWVNDCLICSDELHQVYRVCAVRKDANTQLSRDKKSSMSRTLSGILLATSIFFLRRPWRWYCNCAMESAKVWCEYAESSFYFGNGRLSVHSIVGDLGPFRSHFYLALCISILLAAQSYYASYFVIVRWDYILILIFTHKISTKKELYFTF